MRMMLLKRSDHGFTMIELLMVIMLMSVLAVVSISTMDSGIDETRFDETVAEMKSLRAALIGDLELKQGGSRSSFGYLGDMGTLPTNAQGLSALMINPGVPAWNVNSTIRFALGWNGPYMAGGPGSDITRDAWGTSYIYDGTSNTATLTSLGADKVVGGTQFNQDIVIAVPTTLKLATVHGFVSASGTPYAGAATIELNYPAAGAATAASVSISSTANGYFSFANIPFGKRSAIIYIPNKTTPTQTIGPILFTVDTANFVIPSDVSNYTLASGSGSGTGSGTGGGCSSAGKMTYVAGSPLLDGVKKKLSFKVNVTSNLSVEGITATPFSKTPTYDLVRIDGITRTCSGVGLLAPCPTNFDQYGTFNPAIPVAVGNGKLIEVNFNLNMQGETTVAVELKHDLGCEVFNVPVP
jgi:type II secretion system protein G